MPKVLTIFGAATTGKEFCEQLYSYFQEKVEQHPEDSKFSSILKQVQDIKEDFYENTLGPLSRNSTQQYSNEETKDDDTTDLIGKENV